MMQNFKFVLTVVAGILMLIIVIQNTQAVETNLLFYTFSLPNALLLGLTFAIGVVIGMVVSFTFRGKKAAK